MDSTSVDKEWNPSEPWRWCGSSQPLPSPGDYRADPITVGESRFACNVSSRELRAAPRTFVQQTTTSFCGWPPRARTPHTSRHSILMMMMVRLLRTKHDWHPLQHAVSGNVSVPILAFWWHSTSFQNEKNFRGADWSEVLCKIAIGHYFGKSSEGSSDL